MRKITEKTNFLSSTMLLLMILIGCNQDKRSKKSSAEVTASEEKSDGWKIDFFDDFKSFNPENWQDQRIWVNNEKQCYVPDNQFGTREVSNGSLKIKVKNIGDQISCDNLDKHGKQHPETQYV
ncbi:MAG: hypothetical protein OER83_06135, partial [Flavobacteriaceae bacterium]|nr:hypothetical protein [Flavobacteriaceae bacterium]